MLITCAESRRRKLASVRSMLPQSRKISARSTTSAGGSWKTSSSGRNRYSTGSGNSQAGRNITESRPSWPRMWCIASSDPRASPSTPLCVVIRNRPPERSSSATFARAASRSPSLGGALSASLITAPGPETGSTSIRLITSAGRVEQFRDPHPPLRGVVVVEAERRRPLEPHLARDRRLQYPVRGAQRGQGLLPGLVVAEHTDMDARGAQVGAGVDGGHGHESDSGIVELGRDLVPDHLAHELVHSSHAACGHLGRT